MTNPAMQMDMKTKTKFGTWNVRTMTEPGKLEMVCAEMDKLKLDILGLSECRWNASGEVTTTSGHLFIFSGLPENLGHHSGVGIILTKRIKRSLLNYKAISDRIIMVRLKTRARKISIVQCYAPTEQADREDKSAFYLQLHETLTNIRKGDIRLVMGDLNAKVGSENRNKEMRMGKHGLGHMNVNGSMFSELCLRQQLVIGGTIFPHKNCHKVSWRSPNGMVQNQIDHIAIDQRWRRSLLDVRNKRSADIGSDHHLIYGEIRLKVAAIRTKNEQLSRKFNIEKLTFAERRDLFKREINIQRETCPKQTIEGKWQQIRDTYTNVARDVLGFKESKRKSWISEETWKKIEERRQIKQQLNSNSSLEVSTALLSAYNELNRKVKYATRKQKKLTTPENYTK